MEKQVSHRKVALRGALVAGCSLWMPIQLPACKAGKASSPAAPSTGAASPSTVPGAGMAGNPAEDSTRPPGDAPV